MVNKVVIPALGVAVLTALQMVAQKHVAASMSHQTTFVLGAAIYFVLTLFYIGWHKELIQKEIRGLVVPVVLVMLAATVLGFLANILYFSVVKHHQVSIVAAVTATVPLFVAGLSFLILKEALDAKQIAGIAAIVGGIVLLSQS
jgi:drug/metabolite transporter (DMT)-like permease